MTFVVDASVAAAWVLPDEEAAIADLALERLGDETANSSQRAASEMPSTTRSARN